MNLDSKLAAKHEEHTEAREKLKAASLEQDSAEELLGKKKEYDAAQKNLKEQLGGFGSTPVE